MPKVVEINPSHTPAELRRLAGRAKDANQSRRLLSIAAVLDGMSRAEAAKIGGMDRQTLRDWVHRFNAQGPAGLKDTRRPGNPVGCRQRSSRNCRKSSRPGPTARLTGSCAGDASTFSASSASGSGSRIMSAALASCSRRSASPTSAPGRGTRCRMAGPSRRSKSRGVQKNVARTLEAHVGAIARRKRIEIWFRDEARIGQKNGPVRQWARRGTRPSRPADQRYESAYLFGAICPARGVGAGLALPFADTEAMQLHIDGISLHVARGAHAVLLLDRAGWHTTGNLRWPKNITPILLPSRSPELNPVEQVWQFLRANFLSNRVFDTYDDIIDAACHAWQSLIGRQETITSIGMRKWAHTGQL